MAKSKKRSSSPVRGADVLEAAEELGLNAETIRRFCREGAPHSRNGNKYLLNVPELLAWMQENRKTGEQGRPELASSPDIEAAKLAKELAMARVWTQRANREEGRSVLLSSVTEWMGKNIKAAQARILGVAAQVVHVIQGRTPEEQQEIIEQYLREALIETGDSCERLAEELATA